MTGGRLHRDIRHPSPLPSNSPSRLFLPLAVTPPFEMSLPLPTAGAEPVTTIIVSEVTSLESATDRRKRRRRRSRRRRIHRERERELKSVRERKERKGRMIEIERGSREGAEHGSASIYRTGNKHGAAGVDPSGYRFVYTASACRALPPFRQVVVAGPSRILSATLFPRVVARFDRVRRPSTLPLPDLLFARVARLVTAFRLLIPSPLERG